ncbi:MAG: crossover junction endodeoxyribonuclease RuvC [Thermodesulfovibrionales bacterium]|nr:crossover junction endodeoxyribonuclease RuvC [Thermodesulfovibrionales bacterium]
MADTCKVLILGIDPGSFRCGYGIIKINSINNYQYVSSGRIIIQKKKALSERLKEVFTSIQDIIHEYKPDNIVVEKIFFAKGIKSAMSLGHTRGVILAVASLSDRPIFEYSPLEIKKAVVGYGKADKRQVKKMVKDILMISHDISHDSADALATAICHANTMRL